ncbi:MULTISPECIES: PadR family transcriptional regulator [unclassified Jeotgalibaca]|uniref:PadR family transcriptional regulator n=1 Tax=unclassified Jeotgalibaca TaxID=2621505 RepID=UPI003FD24165
MVTSDVMRGFNDLIILSLLSNKDSYGYQISSTIKELTNGKYSMKETTLYSAFARLEKKEFIRAYSSNETFGKPRTYYTITPLGKAILAEKKIEWKEVTAIVNHFIDLSYEEELT